MVESDHNLTQLESDIFSFSFESDEEKDENDGAVEKGKMNGMVNLYKGVESFRTDKYATGDDDERHPSPLPQKKSGGFLKSRKKKSQVHADGSVKSKKTTVKVSLVKKASRGRGKKTVANTPAAAAPVRLAEILGGVSGVEYPSDSWRNKMENRNSSRSLLICSDDDPPASSQGENPISSVDPTTSEGGIDCTSNEITGEVEQLDKYMIPTIASNDSTLADGALRVILKSAIAAVRAQNWDSVLHYINLHPEIVGMRSAKEDNQTILHVAAGEAPLPKKVATKMVNACPQAVSYTDDDGCLPLHHAASIGSQKAVVKVLLESWPEGATIPNVDGDLPLHVATWGGKSNEDISKIIMDANPSAVMSPNSVGGLPLHMACCKENASATTVRRLIRIHKNSNIPITHLDNNGNSPLHVAIKTRASKEVVSEILNSWDTTEAFSQLDGNRMYPLHIALVVHRSNPDVIEIISKAAPAIRELPLKNGLMPARLAIERQMPENVVHDLVLADMPIQLGMKTSEGMSDVVSRRHNYSWWFLAAQYDKYMSVVDRIFVDCSVPEIIALVQVTDPNGSSNLFDEVHPKVREVIKKHLRFCERYELITLKKAKMVDGTLVLRGVDHGKDVPWSEINTPGVDPHPCKSGYTTIDCKAHEDSGVEVVLFNRPKRDVMLLCCPQDSAEHKEVMKEVKIRNTTKFSVSQCQRLYNAHVVNGRKIGCEGNIVCLSFERPLLTLRDIFESSRFRKRKSKEWARKSCNLLKRVAEVLNYLHNKGFIHGNVDPSSIAKFQGDNNWKLMMMGQVTPIGQPMSGKLRSCVPPESISEHMSAEMDVSDGVTKIVSFDESLAEAPERKSPQRSKSSDETENFNRMLETAPLTFSPEKCTADVSWDVWSLGLIMGQLLLGQSMVYLPNFENAPDAHLKNLYNYDEKNIRIIGNATYDAAGLSASELIKRLLHPSPEMRPKSVQEVLNDRYFTDELGVC